MIECTRNPAQDRKTERIKVSCLEIIVTMIGKNPCYEIKYKKIREDYSHVGYSSYKLENDLTWRDECFEVVRETQTNADRIRNMSDEELADTLFASCLEIMKLEECTNTDNCGVCKRCVLDWLQSEAE